ncbi:hypothetical protein L1D55_14245 [Vibrio sp. Isolate22]|uniref:hypothetical protein n=1 Tax=Vibrio sp. Isolate22 TaxID=2908532 RepID=UPI001EFCA26F|nr:hypothetical protein [Vibrio sp. Isolate22]MCG9692886.1 hypothetical protein [Vibrio sp. Isolate22]
MKHLGTSPVAAAERIEGMFAHQKMCSLNSDCSVNTYDSMGHVISRQPLLAHLYEFCSYAKTFDIFEYSLKINTPLRLIDLWEDDPIGSAGPKVVDSSKLTSSLQKEVYALFAPFLGVIYPQHILRVFSFQDIENIKRYYADNKLFINEFNKRKERSKAIGEDFNRSQYQEIIWLDFTIKLKNWALKNGFDSFVYANHKEGNGEDTYVTLIPDQVSYSGTSLEFNEGKYLAEMPQLISEMIINMRNKPLHMANHVLWAQKDPMCFWTER